MKTILTFILFGFLFVTTSYSQSLEAEVVREGEQESEKSEVIILISKQGVLWATHENYLAIPTPNESGDSLLVKIEKGKDIGINMLAFKIDDKDYIIYKGVGKNNDTQKFGIEFEEGFKIPNPNSILNLEIIEFEDGTQQSSAQMYRQKNGGIARLNTKVLRFTIDENNKIKESFGDYTGISHNNDSDIQNGLVEIRKNPKSTLEELKFYAGSKEVKIDLKNEILSGGIVPNYEIQDGKLEILNAEEDYESVNIEMVSLNNPDLGPATYSDTNSKTGDINEYKIPKMQTGEDQINRLVEYYYIFDFEEKELKILTNEFEKVRSNRISTLPNIRTGRTLNIRLINFNPLSDSVSLRTKFINYNEEGSETFMSNAGSFLGLSDENKDQVKEAIQDSTEDADIQSGKLSPEQEEIRDKVKSIRKSMIHLVRESEIKKKDFNNLQSEIKNFLDVKVITSSIISTKFNEKINDVFSEARDAEVLEIEKKLLEIVKEIAVIWRSIVQPGEYAIGDIFIENADLLELKFETFKNGKVHTASPTTYKAYTKGGFKVDFSAGFFGTGLVDESFVTKDVEVITQDTTLDMNGNITKIDTLTENKYRIIKNDHGNYRFGAGALVHVYTRLSKFVNPSLSAGFILDNDAATQFLFGGSLILGRERRWIFSGGISFGKVKRLGTGLDEETLYDRVEGQTSDIPTTEKWTHNYFWGFTYNF